MKDALLRILQTHPATAGRPDDFLDTLAEDIQALIIRATVPGNPDDAAEELEHKVTDVYNDQFGATLFNLFSTQPFLGKRKLYFSSRARVVRAMIQTMLLEQDEHFDRTADAYETPAAVLRQRLEELAVPEKQFIN